jgi:hypothetical protein
LQIDDNKITKSGGDHDLPEIVGLCKRTLVYGGYWRMSIRLKVAVWIVDEMTRTRLGSGPGCWSWVMKGDYGRRTLNSGKYDGIVV